MTNSSAGPSSDAPPQGLVARGNVGDLLWWLLSGYVVLIVTGSLWLRAGGVMAEGQTLNFDRSLFLSVSAATLTGFQQTIGPNDFNAGSVQGPVILIVLTVAGSLLMLIAGGLGAARVLRLPFTDKQVIVAALTAELLAVLAGTAALYTAHADLTDAVLQAACAFGNSGAVITARGRFPSAGSWQTQAVLLPLAIVGGLGLPAVMELYQRLLGGARQLSRHTKTVAVLTAGAYLAATCLLFITALFHRQSGSSVRGLFVASSTTAINARTAGLPFEILSAFAGPGQMLIVLLMIVGASPAGTAGGLKITTLWHLFTGVGNVLRGRIVPRAFGIAAVWLCAYLAMAGIGLLLLSAVAPQMPADQAGSLTLSALSNVGLSHDPVSIVGGGLLVLDLIMLAGRLAPLVILWWMATTPTDAEVLVA